jgi:YVTN family beta-propeller protein
MDPGVAAAKNAKPTRSTTIALTPNERNVVVVNRLANSVSIIQVKDKNGNDVSNKLAEITVGEEPRCVAVHPSNRAAYVTNAISGTVSVVDLNRHTQVAEIPVGTEPRGCALTADGSLLYVANLTEGTVSIIVTSDPLNPISDGAVTVGGRPWAVAITDNGTGNISDDTVFVTDAFAEVIPNFSDPTFDGNGEARDQGKQGVVHAFPAGNGNPPITKITLAPLANSGFNANRISPNNFCGPGPPAPHSLIFCPDPDDINDPINTADPQGVFPNQLTSGLIRGNRLYLPNIGAQPEPPEMFNVNVQALVYNVDVNALSEVATEHVNLNNQIKVETAQPPPSLDRTFGNDLVAIDGNVAGDRFVIVSRGGNQIFRATLDASGQLDILNSAKTGVDCRLQTGNLPTGVAMRKDGTRAYADNDVNFSVTSMDTDNCLTLQLDISSSDPALAPAAASPSTISNRSGRSIPPIP